MEKQRYYMVIDMKSFFASVECAERGLNPFETNLVVADPSRGKNALCLAITPKMKALGVKNRCRMSEIPQTISYITALPRMQFYIEYAADIYEIYLQYFSKEDIHVYSIDECILDVTAYLEPMKKTPKELAVFLMNEIARKVHIPSTTGIGTNMYLAKIALDITAKHAKDHIGYLDEELYRKTLWNHRPLSDFWMIGRGVSNRLSHYGIYDMQGIATAPQELLYKVFGKDAELLIDHAWGREPCLMKDIKNYTGKSKSVSFSQILPKDYTFEQARVVVEEMILNGCRELMNRHLITNHIGILVGYSGEFAIPNGNVRKLTTTTNLPSYLVKEGLEIFDAIADKNTLIRRLGLCFDHVCDEGCEGYDLFSNFDQVEKEKNREEAVLNITTRFGKNALLRGVNYLEGATQKDRNTYIGGHRAGFDDKRRES